MSNFKKIFEVVDELKIKPRFLSVHSANSFIAANSSPRGLMYSSHFAQSGTLLNGEEKIVQSGLEKGFGENTWSRKFENTSRIIKVVQKYGGVDIREVSESTEYTVLYEDLTTGEIDMLVVPKYHKLHQSFGFRYKENLDVKNDLTKNNIVPGGTILADSPAVTKNSGYKYGINANCLLATDPAVAEDAIRIKESLAQKFAHTIYETRTGSCGVDSFPLNIHGDVDNYIIFPEVGDCIPDHSVLMATRKYDSDLAPALTSINDVLDFDTMFDNVIYMLRPGGKLIDITVYRNPRYKKEMYTGTTEQLEKYANGTLKYYEEIIDTYEALQKDHYRMYKSWELPISEQLSRYLVEAYAMVNKEKIKINKIFKKEDLDLYRIDFVVEHLIVPRVGAKLTDLNGNKGIEVEVCSDSDFPPGVDAIMDPTSVPSRMNIGRLYEQYFNSMSRQVKSRVSAMFGDATADIGNIVLYAENDIILKAFDYALGLLKIIGTEQYTTYAGLTNVDMKRTIVHEIVTKEFYIYYTVDSDKLPYQVVMDSLKTEYATEFGTVLFNVNGKFKDTIDKMMVAPIYLILLAKTGDTFLSTASSKTNHYGLPVGNGKNDKYSLPWRNSPTKAFSETEVRLYSAFVSLYGIAELKDRTNSIFTHSHIYRSILNADKPTDINNLVDRNVIPYGDDVALNLMNTILNCGGTELYYEAEGDE